MPLQNLESTFAQQKYSSFTCRYASRYYESRDRNYYQSSSFVRGNPWRNHSQHFNYEFPSTEFLSKLTLAATTLVGGFVGYTISNDPWIGVWGGFFSAMIATRFL